MTTIRNMPESANHYEFIVVREVNNDLWYWGAYASGYKANVVAQKISGVIIHNVRIQGYKP